MGQLLSTPLRMWRGKQSQGQVGNTGWKRKVIKGRKRDQSQSKKKLQVCSSQS